MDRHSLLEQKRQRLQQLRLKRPEPAEIAANSIVDALPPQKPQKDVAIQTDATPVRSAPHSVPHSAPRPERTTFDKGIQVDALIDAVEKPKQASKPVVAPKPPAIPKPVPVKEPTRLQRLLAEEIPYESPSQDSDQVPAFAVASQFKTAVERPILVVDFSPHHPRLMVVAYSHTKTNKTRSGTPVPRQTLVSPGLAVVYDLKESPAAEFFLNCTSPITFIAFSKTDPTKVVGGLEDGKVVIWDLSTTEPATVALLPLLSSTVVTAMGSSGPTKYTHHSAPIVFIEQLGGSNPSMVAVSQDGVVNVWSTSFLELPKQNSVKLRNPTKDPITGIRNDLVVLSVLFMERETVSNNDNTNPEYRFLDRMVVGTESGTLYQLANSEDHILRTYQDQTAVVHSDNVTCLAEIQSRSSTGGNFVVSSHLGWSLKVWDLSKETPIATVPTLFLVNKVALHPKRQAQLVTVGAFNKNQVRPVVHFWDMGIKSMGPICELAIPSTDSKNLTYATAAKFTADGDKLAVAFNDGTLVIWSIDVLALDRAIEGSKNTDVDGGLQTLL